MLLIFVMLPTYTYPEILTAKCLLSNKDFIFHHPPSPHEVTTSLEVENSGNKNLSPGKILNGNLPPVLSILKFALASWVWKLVFCAQNMAGWGRQSQIIPWGIGTEHTVYSPLKKIFGFALQKLLSHWPLVMSCPCLQGPGNSPWLMESLSCEYTFHLRRAAIVSVRTTQKAQLGNASQPCSGPSGVLK